jgi:predicted Zn finger-like uncharacterized protein
MRIVCPACSAAYEVEANLLLPGRKTRCMRCAAEWAPVPKTVPVQPAGGETPHTDGPGFESKQDTNQQPEDPGPPPNPPAVAVRVPPQPSAMERLSATPARITGGLTLRLAWAASVILLLMAAAGLFEWREAVMEIWPPSTRIYAAVGLAPTQDSPRN